MQQELPKDQGREHVRWHYGPFDALGHCARTACARVFEERDQPGEQSIDRYRIRARACLRATPESR